MKIIHKGRLSCYSTTRNQDRERENGVRRERTDEGGGGGGGRGGEGGRQTEMQMNSVPNCSANN